MLRRGVYTCVMALLPVGIGAALPGQWYIETLELSSNDGGNRTYHLYVPSTVNPSPMLVLYFHGYQDNCTYFGGLCSADLCYWPEEAEKRGFIFASLCGLGDSWNAGACCSPSGGSFYDHGPNDIGFVNAVIEDIPKASGQAIDANSIFAAGFSNGGMFAQMMACQGGLIRAVASCSAIVGIFPGGAPGLSSCDWEAEGRAIAVPVLDIHGTDDPIVPWRGFGWPFYGYPPVEENMKRWASRNGCNDSAQLVWNNGNFSSTLWPGCDGPGDVELVTNDGGVHQCTCTEEFCMTSYMADFFEKILRKPSRKKITRPAIFLP